MCIICAIYGAHTCTFFAVMQHRGEIVKEAVYKSGFPITRLATRLRKSRRWMYNAFENTNLSVETILEIGLIIGYDFTDEIKELKLFKPLTGEPTAIGEDGPTYQSGPETVVYWKNKYLALLEEHSALLKEMKEKKGK